MTEQEKRAEFCRRTGRIATSATVEYQAFLWGIEAGSAAEREACARVCRSLAEGCRKVNGYSSQEMMQAYEYAEADILKRSNC